jgi:hypothetical protein
MSLRIIDGVIGEVGEAAELATSDPTTDERRVTGRSFAHVRIDRARGKTEIVQQVSADAALAGFIATGSTGRFAFYNHGPQSVLCGFSDGSNVHIAAATDDPLAIEIDAQRTRGKRKILIGIVMIPTIIGLFFFDSWIRAGRAILKANPRPRRPSEEKLRRKLAR